MQASIVKPAQQWDQKTAAPDHASRRNVSSPASRFTCQHRARAETKKNSKRSTKTTRGQRRHASRQQLSTTAAANLCMTIHGAFTARKEHDSTSSSAPLRHCNRSSATTPTVHAHQTKGKTPPTAAITRTSPSLSTLRPIHIGGHGSGEMQRSTSSTELCLPHTRTNVT
jgi:hypothetical protein